MNDYGFTNADEDLKRVQDFRDAAVADGWSIKPTYEKHEGVDRAASLDKDGYHMMVLTRDNRDKKSKWSYEAHISIWGPDRLAIHPPETYDWEKIQEGTHVCSSCGQRVEKTVRFSFAGRCCEACLPEMRRKYEYLGWCD